MKHHTGCSDCIHNKANSVIGVGWCCTEEDRIRIEAQYHGSVFNCFDYHAMQQRTNEIDALIDTAKTARFDMLDTEGNVVIESGRALTDFSDSAVARTINQHLHKAVCYANLELFEVGMDSELTPAEKIVRMDNIMQQLTNARHIIKRSSNLFMST